MTLTYSEENIPNLWVADYGSEVPRLVGTLVARHVQLWLKRLRKLYSPLTFRFFAVGEYGSKSWRPHYHAILFGYPGCKRVGGTYRDLFNGETVARKCCEWCDLLDRSWGRGLVHSGAVSDASAGYISEYVLKKMTRAGDPRLLGRNPEFARMSLRPGIGANNVAELASEWLRYGLEDVRDVPAALGVGRKQLPIGRYLRNKWRVQVGRPEGMPSECLNEYQEKLLALREGAKASEANPSFKEAVKREFLGSVQNVEAKAVIFKRRKAI